MQVFVNSYESNLFNTNLSLYEKDCIVVHTHLYTDLYRLRRTRTFSYVRNVMDYTTRNTVIPTPPHPEFSSAHAVIGKASSVVLESFFGKKCSFVDRTHETLYGARTYNTLAEYASEGTWSRVLAGIHYHPTADAGLIQGKKVGDLVNSIPFKIGAQHD